LKGLDLFSGVGGSSAGARAAGVEMVGAVDAWEIATSTYQDNFPKAQVVTARLETLDRAQLKARLGEIDILLASPECTNHTPAKGAGPRDETSRATAMLVVDYVRAFLPRWLVIENVVEMRPWARYEELKRSLAELGYALDEQVLDAKDYGVPQSRRRLFIVGDRAALPRLVNWKRRGPKKGAKSVLDPEGQWPTTLLRREGRAKRTVSRADRAIATLGEETPFILVYYGSDKRGSANGGWQPLRRPLRTITTLDRFALVAPSNDGPRMRMLQVPELRRAMGFDNDYRLQFGVRRDRIRLLGNAVCPPVMTAVLQALMGTQDSAEGVVSVDPGDSPDGRRLTLDELLACDNGLSAPQGAGRGCERAASARS
jgi:DNA (cytosine-5)-methyltransferase 1